MMQVTGFTPLNLNTSNMGWTCPGCARCFSPSTAMCWFCPTNKLTVTQTDPAYPTPVIEPWPPTGPTWDVTTSSISGYCPLPGAGHLQILNPLLMGD